MSRRCCVSWAWRACSTPCTPLKTHAIAASLRRTAFTSCCAGTIWRHIAARSSTMRSTTCARRIAWACRPCGCRASAGACRSSICACDQWWSCPAWFSEQARLRIPAPPGFHPMPRAKGERKLEILKALAQMLEAPKWERIPTAALAESLGVSEAALYRHFASKAQMYEGLIEFIESSVFSLVNKIGAETSDGVAQAEKIVVMLLTFAEKNPGMTRVLIGDALVHEDQRLQARIN